MSWITNAGGSIAPPGFTPVDLTGQNTSIGATTLFAVGTTGPNGPGVYRIDYELQVTTAADISGQVYATFTWTDRDTNASKSVNTGPTADATDITGQVSGSITINVAASTNIQYATTYTSNQTSVALAYAIHLRLEGAL